MLCEQSVEMMSEWLDGRLNATEVAMLDGHVATCSRCQMDREALQSLDRLFASAPLIEPSTDLRARTMARLNRRGEARRALAGGLALALAAATLGLLFLAPLLADLFGAQSLWPVLSRGGPETAERLVTLIWTMGRAMTVLLRNLAGPLALMTVCVVVAAVLLNALWLRTLRRLRAAP